MGSGHFLVFALPMLAAFREEEEGLTLAEACDAVLSENLFGLELDPRCTQIAAFNLALAAWKLGGYRKLPRLNLACCGIGISVEREKWVSIASAGTPRFLMAELYSLFVNAPLLGSLIDPARVAEGKFKSELETILPLVRESLEKERRKEDEDTSEMAVLGLGIAEAAEILAQEFTLVVTNVPYLGRGKQNDALREFCESRFPNGKGDLATCFVERCLTFCSTGGTVSLVTPNNWLYLGKYSGLREQLLKEASWNFVAKLGPRAFETISGEVVNVALIGLSRLAPKDQRFFGIDVSKGRTPTEKEESLRTLPPTSVSQSAQVTNPDQQILFKELGDGPLLRDFAGCYQGLTTADDGRWRRCFWEMPVIGSGWKPMQGPSQEEGIFSGRQNVISRKLLDNKASGGVIRGRDAWGKAGIAIDRVGSLSRAIYTGELFHSLVPVVIPHKTEHLTAVAAFCLSPEFPELVRQMYPGLSVDNGYLEKVPFDPAHWKEVAQKKFPCGLPKPTTTNLTQWVFDGQPAGADWPLQVAVCRLLGYQWPRQTGATFPDCPPLSADQLVSLSDEDGIVCISAMKGEQPAPERLRSLLAAAYGAQWTNDVQARLLAQSGFENRSLEDYLRNGFFEEHCRIFHQRPFIWQIWDGTKDGFSALVNYHKLDRSLLEKLTYAYLGDWISRQRTAVSVGEEGSDAKLTVALELKAKLEKILGGEAPYDIFIRWKPSEKQPVGWQPELDDGVRLNIRPFMIADVLRRNPNINWKKDRGKEPSDAPWSEKFKGERVNDHHLTLAEKGQDKG